MWKERQNIRERLNCKKRSSHTDQSFNLIQMKIVLTILGLVLLAFGVLIIFGTVMDFVEGTSSYSVAVDLIGMFFLGLLPAGLGSFMLYKGLSNSSRRK